MVILGDCWLGWGVAVTGVWWKGRKEGRVNWPGRVRLNIEGRPRRVIALQMTAA